MSHYSTVHVVEASDCDVHVVLLLVCADHVVLESDCTVHGLTIGLIVYPLVTTFPILPEKVPFPKPDVITSLIDIM